MAAGRQHEFLHDRWIGEVVDPVDLVEQTLMHRREDEVVDRHLRFGECVQAVQIVELRFEGRAKVGCAHVGMLIDMEQRATRAWHEAQAHACIPGNKRLVVLLHDADRDRLRFGHGVSP